ncbi:hypothetical protein BDW72DRAFT_208830 [Aspergillus terricola var. indicus]
MTPRRRSGKPRVIMDTMTFKPSEFPPYSITKLVQGADPSAGVRITSLDAHNLSLIASSPNAIMKVTLPAAMGTESKEHSPAPRERGLICATKWYPYNANGEKVGAHRDHKLEQMFNKSLSELGTDCVGIFYLHAADRATPFDEPLRKPMNCIFQCVYNAITRNIQPDLVAACRPETIPTEGRHSNTDDATFESLRTLEPAAQKHNLSLLEVAFPRLIHNSALNIKDGGNDRIRDLQELQKGPLPDEVLTALDEAWMVSGSHNYWHLEIDVFL